jgi:ferredoxin-thioredoxin reductase catalytic subunit
MEMSRAEELEQSSCTARILYLKVGAELLANMHEYEQERLCASHVTTSRAPKRENIRNHGACRCSIYLKSQTHSPSAIARRPHPRFDSE